MDFSVTDGTTLEDLLALQLHLFEDEVRSIVDKAVKEMTIEKVFFFSTYSRYAEILNNSYFTKGLICNKMIQFQIVTEISQTWTSMELSYIDHYQTSVLLLKCDEELIETLEDHQVHLYVLRKIFLCHGSKAWELKGHLRLVL